MAIPAAVLAVVAVLIFLYALGFYDFTFIDRPETSAADVPVTEAPATEAPATEASVTEAPSAIIPANFPDVGAAGADGWSLTDKPYADGMTLAELRVKMEYTNDYSLRTRSWYKVAEYDDTLDDLPPEPVWERSEEPVPALEAYMGYIFADGGEYQDVYDSFGRYVGGFDCNSYEYAYKRASDGTPLFRRLYTYYYNTEDDSASDYAQAFNFYGYNGNIFDAGYSDITANRGVMADYPSYFGLYGDTLSRKVVHHQLVQTTSRGRLRTRVKQVWQYMWGESPAFEGEFSAAFPYSEGYACVADADGVMYFVDTYGRKTFETKREYWSADFTAEGRQVVEQLLLPFDESKAVGCYYFNHGLVMARRQIYDYYQLKTFKIFWIMSDENVMLYADGSEFPIPTGYKTQAYSDGVILLTRGDRYGYIDYTGAWVGAQSYDGAKPFSEGLAACSADGKWGMIDTSGNTVLPFIYDSVQSASSGVIVCHSPVTGWHVYLKMTK